MNEQDGKTFVFNENLDKTFLQDLFEGDLRYAEIVFGDFLKDLPVYWKEVEYAFEKNDIRELGSAVHKCKTLFGYVGSAEVQGFFQLFEDRCRKGEFEGSLQQDFNQLVQKKDEARNIIESEYQRLKSFHASL